MSELKQGNERFYWLKLKKDFFKRHDVKVIEGMENGKDYVLFYLKLLCESLDHNGNLRFSDTIPYSESMLASVTGTNIDVVRSAMKILVSLNLVEVLDDQTIYMREVEKMTGSETASTIRSRECRLRQNEQKMLQCNKMQQDCNGEQQNATQEYRDKSIEYRNNNTTPVEQILIEGNDKNACARERLWKNDEERGTAISKINEHLRKNCNLNFFTNQLAQDGHTRILEALEKIVAVILTPDSKSDAMIAMKITEKKLVHLVQKFLNETTKIANERAYIWTSLYNMVLENKASD